MEESHAELEQREDERAAEVPAFRDALRRALDPYDGDLELEVESVSTYEEVGMLTMDDGLLVRLRDGQKFAVTIQRYHGYS